jgi:ABC-type phosphate transport system substrate-binding protein
MNIRLQRQPFIWKSSGNPPWAVTITTPRDDSGSQSPHEGFKQHMMNRTNKRRLTRSLAALTVGAGLFAGSVANPASADPAQVGALVGMGSDTTQDVMNALAGFNFGLSYTAVNSGAPAFRHIVSWNALPAQTATDNCVAPVVNGPTFTRPNGSGSGRRALYHASGVVVAGAPVGWNGPTVTLDNGTVLPRCASGVNIGGMVNFARSSAGPSVVGSDTTFIPFGRDALTFASYRPGPAGTVQVTSLTRRQLSDAYRNIPQTIPDPDGTGTLRIIPCGIQTGSGTHQFWRDTVLQTTQATEDLAVAECLTVGARLQESKGDQLKLRGDALDVTVDDFVVVVGYSAAAYIAQANGVSEPNGFSDITLGSISDDALPGPGGANLGSPVTGVAPNLLPNSTFYASLGHGRDVYNVFRRSLIVNTTTGALLNNATTALFASPTSKVCQATATINKFGFAAIPNCGQFNVINGAWETAQA